MASDTLERSTIAMANRAYEVRKGEEVEGGQGEKMRWMRRNGNRNRTKPEGQSGDETTHQEEEDGHTRDERSKRRCRWEWEWERKDKWRNTCDPH